MVKVELLAGGRRDGKTSLMMDAAVKAAVPGARVLVIRPGDQFQIRNVTPEREEADGLQKD